jgi:hypothetical protein
MLFRTNIVKVESIANIGKAYRNVSLFTVSGGESYNLQLVCRCYAETHPILYNIVQYYTNLLILRVETKNDFDG